MDRPAVYLETSVISYLSNRPSRDLIVAGHQATTREWWESKRHRYDLYISELVIAEASRGDTDAAARRMALLDGMQVLRIGDTVAALAQRFLDRHAIPAAAGADAVHVAIAAVSGIQYLVTWNCKHIANAERFDAIATVCVEMGFRSPIICTPDELTGES